MVMDGQLPPFDEGHGEVNVVSRVLYGIALAELDMPHIVVTRSTDTGEATFSGPYATGLEALAAAEAESQVDRQAGGRGDITFHVSALYPALEDTRPACAGAEAEPVSGPVARHSCGSAPRPVAPVLGPASALVSWLRASFAGRRARAGRAWNPTRGEVVLMSTADTRRSSRR
jgi:hypothetical protein